MQKTILSSFAAAVLAVALAPQSASAALVAVVSSQNIASSVGAINDLRPGGCAVACVGGAQGLTVNFTDGAQAIFDVAFSYQDDGVNTTSAFVRITNLAITNPTLAIVSDTFLVFSDIFKPSLANLPVGVGIFGFFGQNGGGLINGATATAQMNFLTNPLGDPGVPAGFTLTTPTPNGTGFLSPVNFWAFNVQNDPNGGVQQLVGGVNFTLAPGSTAIMPGSMLLTENNNELLTDEAPEPDTMAICAASLAGLVGMIRRRRQA